MSLLKIDEWRLGRREVAKRRDRRAGAQEFAPLLERVANKGARNIVRHGSTVTTAFRTDRLPRRAQQPACPAGDAANNNARRLIQPTRIVTRIVEPLRVSRQPPCGIVTVLGSGGLVHEV